MTNTIRSSSYCGTFTCTPDQETDYQKMLQKNRSLNKRLKAAAVFDEKPFYERSRLVRRFRLGKNNPNAAEYNELRPHPVFGFPYRNRMIRKDHGERFDVYSYTEICRF